MREDFSRQMGHPKSDEQMLSEQVLILPHAEHRVKMEMRERLLDAADRVLRQKGLVGTTTRSITNEAQCAEGTLYLYFKSRAELFLALFQRRLAASFPGPESLESAREDRAPEALLLDFAEKFLRFQHEAAPLLSALFADPELLKKYRELVFARHPNAPRALPSLVEYIRRAQRQNDIDKAVDANVAAEALLGACFARAFHDAMFDDRTSPAGERKFLRELIRALLHP